MELSQLAIFGALALPPLLGWAIFWRRRMSEPEPTRVLVELFIFGALAALPLVWLRNFLAEHSNFDLLVIIGSPFALILIFALVEETIKSLALIGGVEHNKNRFDKWEDGFEFAVLVALGFAFTENVIYFFEQSAASGLSAEFWYLYLFRSLGTALGHIVFTGTFGYFYACAYIVKKVVPKEKHEKPLAHLFQNLGKVLRRPFHITLSHLLPRRDSARGHTSGEVLIEGFLLAILLHAIFNSFLYFSPFDQNLSFLTVPLLVAAVWWYGKRWRPTN